MEFRKPFKVITSDDVANQMNQVIVRVNEALHIPPTITRILLDRYKWDGQTLMDKFFIMGDELFFRDARIINPLEYTNDLEPDAESECRICFETTEMTGLQCGHRFCRECWRMYLTAKINDEGVQTIPCADSKCDIIIEDATVKSFVTDPVVISKYNRLICNSFIQWNKSLHWCTSPGCNYVIDIQASDCVYVTCKCGNQFCTECKEDVHAPISCALLQKWKSDDSATQSYLAVNTKPCPNCNFSIEKNGGCPHMNCKNCRHEFCWKCLKPWKNHNEQYVCRTPEENKEIRESRSLVQRLKYCFDRYLYNRQALKDEQGRFDLVWKEFEYKWDLNAGVDVLYDCRRFLMYSYAFIYYLEEDNNVYIFETNLDDVEAKTDKLSVAMEEYMQSREADEDFWKNEAELRGKIVDSVSHCKSLRKKWLSEIEKGNEEGSWQYRE